MALTRGTKAKFPCPVCLIPGDQLKYATRQGVLRQNAQGQAVLAQTQTKKAREADLKALGLRNIVVSRAFKLT